MRISLVLAITGMFMLAGCEGARDEGNVRDENVTETSHERLNDAAPLNRSEEPKNVAAPENRMAEPEISDEQQIQDDAEASGMTSRLSDENGAVPPAEAAVASDPANRPRDASAQR